jgi:phosphoglycolate phosphatase-like HAD superfamily hydrolase
MQVCLFDIDGTLLLSGGAGKAAMERAVASAFGTKPTMDGIPFSGRTDRAIARDLFQLHAIAETADNWERFLSAYLSHLPSCLDKYQGSVLPGVASLLDCLRVRQDVATGLLTGNIRAGARLKLGHYGLYHHFAFGGFGDKHYNRDEVARDALAAARRYSSSALDLNQVWVIGDTPLDIRCARSIGARAVGVTTGWHSFESLAAEKPDLLLPDLSDPAPLLALWDELR